MSGNELRRALGLLEKAGCKVGPDWDAAHDIAQAHEGDPLFDWLHALVHRIEGDAWNAGYWYRRAGRAPFEGGFSDEARAIANAPMTGGGA
ncbi:hypothetical protein ACLB6G_06425 [Zhengella sp. ZM62]|uniref:hypothetical protein n=1 Tax=Zhengella sedimenti TaxID=3390035 RepID=UPI003974A07D